MAKSKNMIKIPMDEYAELLKCVSRVEAFKRYVVHENYINVKTCAAFFDFDVPPEKES